MSSSHLPQETRTKDPTLSLKPFQTSMGQTLFTNNSAKRLNEASLTGAAKGEKGRLPGGGGSILVEHLPLQACLEGSVRVQSGKKQNHHELWAERFITGIRPYLIVGGAGEVEVLEDQTRGHQSFILRSHVRPPKWDCQGDAPGEDSGQLYQPRAPTSAGLLLSVERWAWGQCWAAGSKAGKKSWMQGRELDPTGTATSITTYNHSSLQTVMAASSHLPSKSHTNSSFV